MMRRWLAGVATGFAVMAVTTAALFIGAWYAVRGAWRLLWRPWHGWSHRNWVVQVKAAARSQREQCGPGHDPSGIHPADWEVFCDGIASIVAEQRWLCQRADREKGQQ